MDLTSPVYLAFLAVSISLYFWTPTKFRPIVLLLLSTIFISTFDIFILIFLALYLLTNYFLASKLNKNSSISILGLGLIINVGLLVYYKYSAFLGLTNRNIIAPIGISFFTFKTIALLVDSYKKQFPSLNLLTYANLVTFFPEFLSGPIDRYQHFNQNSHQNHFTSSNFYHGSYRIIFGLFKKLVLANNIAVIINPVYQNFLPYTSLDLYLVSVLYSFQLLFDFSGYTDIAIGSAKIMGINIPENFYFPYLITNIRQFWNRWHITLSCWFRDYLYIPLGGNRRGPVRQIINVMIVFLVTGIWHGAGFGFIAWGLLHGFYQVVALFFEKQQKIKIKLHPIISIFFTFNLVNFAWIFFRLKSVRASLLFLKTMVYLKPGLSLYLTTLLAPFLASLLILYLLRHENKITNRLFITLVCLLSIVLFANTSQVDFLYFKF